MIYSPNSALVARLLADSRQLREALALLRNSDQRVSVQRLREEPCEPSRAERRLDTSR